MLNIKDKYIRSKICIDWIFELIYIVIISEVNLYELLIVRHKILKIFKHSTAFKIHYNISILRCKKTIIIKPILKHTIEKSGRYLHISIFK